MPEPYRVKPAFVPVRPLQNQQAVFDSGWRYRLMVGRHGRIPSIALLFAGQGLTGLAALQYLKINKVPRWTRAGVWEEDARNLATRARAPNRCGFWLQNSGLSKD